MEHATEADGSPWKLGYQMNERYLKWDSSAQRQLILIWVAQQVRRGRWSQITAAAHRSIPAQCLAAADLFPLCDVPLAPTLPSQLDITLPELEERVAELAMLLPDLDSKLDRMQVGWGWGLGGSGSSVFNADCGGLLPSSIGELWWLDVGAQGCHGQSKRDSSWPRFAISHSLPADCRPMPLPHLPPPAG